LWENFLGLSRQEFLGVCWKEGLFPVTHAPLLLRVLVVPSADDSASFEVTQLQAKPFRFAVRSSWSFLWHLSDGFQRTHLGRAEPGFITIVQWVKGFRERASSPSELSAPMLWFPRLKKIHDLCNTEKAKIKK